MRNICPNFANPKVKQEFADIKKALGSEELAYDFWDLNGGYGVEDCSDGTASSYYQSLIKSGRTKNEAIIARFTSLRMSNDIDDAVSKGDIIELENLLHRNRNNAIDKLISNNLINAQTSNAIRFTQFTISKDYSTKQYEEYLNKVNSILRQHGLSAYIVKENQLSISDRVLISPEIDRSTTDFRFINNLCRFLSDKTGVNYHICKDRSEFVQRINRVSGLHKSAAESANGAYVVIDNTVYLIQNESTAATTFEEFAHPIVAALQACNTNTFNSILQQLYNSKDKNIVNLIKQINSTYSDYGKQTIENEIVSHYIADYLKNAFSSQHTSTHNNSMQHLCENAMSNIHDQYIEYLHDEYGLSKTDIKNNKLFTFDIFDKNFNINSFNDLIKIFNRNNVKVVGLSNGIYSKINELFNHEDGRNKKDLIQDVYFSLYNSDLDKFDIANQIQEHYQALFKQYRNNSSKSAIDARRENQIKKVVIDLRGKNNRDSLRIFLLDAIQQIGLTGRFNNNPDSIISILQKHSKTNYQNLTISDIQNMYGLLYDTYKQIYDLVNGNISDKELDTCSLDSDSNAQSSSLRNVLDLVDTSLNNIYKQLTEAQFVVAEKFVDKLLSETTGETSMLDKDGNTVRLSMNPEQFRRYRAQMIDWFMYNQFNHDNSFFDFFTNFDQTSNVAIANIVYMIQKAKARASKSSYDKCSKLMRLYKRLRPFVSVGNWQKNLIEFDKDGYPTGYFKSKYNYGQCEQDMKKEIAQFIKDFELSHQHSYYVHESDWSIDYNTVTNEPFYSEEYYFGSNFSYQIPDWVEFQIGIEKIRAKYIVRRYSPKYYLERLSKPYRDGDPNPGHGLSPRTMYLYDQAQSQINYYLDKCYDETDGFSHPERLQESDQISLDYYQDQLDQLSDQFDQDGNLKSPEQVQMAQEIQAWQAYIQQHIGIQINRDAFEDKVLELQKKILEAKNSGDKDALDKANKDLSNFYKYNAKYSIAPEYFELAFAGKQDNSTKISQIYRQIRRSMQKLTRDRTGALTMDLSRFQNNPEYFLLSRSYDQMISDSEFAEKSQTDDPDDFDFNEWFESMPVYYRNGRGEYVNANTGQTMIAASREAKAFKAHLLELWSTRILYSNTKTMNGLFDKNGQLMDFSGMSLQQIQEWINNNVLTYQKLVFAKDQDGNYILDEDGNRVEKIIQQNLSVFSTLIPAKQEFEYNGKKMPSILWNPKGRVYTKKYNKDSDLIDGRFDESIGLSYHPNPKMYSVDYNQSTEQKYLMEELKRIIKECFRDMGFEGIYDNRIPQIEAGISAMISRMKSPKKSILTYIDNYYSGRQQDSDVRDEKDLPVDFTGHRKYTLATRFMDKLKDPRHLSTDLVGGVMQLIIEAEHYKEFNAIQDEINLADRIMNKLKMGGSLSNKKSDSRAYTQFRKMLQVMYYQDSGIGLNSDERPSRAVLRTTRVLDYVIGKASLLMLGFNVASAHSGFGGSEIYLATRYALGSDTVIFSDFLRGLIYSFPTSIKQLLTIGTILPTSKTSALMYLNDLSKTKREEFRGTYKSRFRRVASKLAMGIFQMLDILSNNILTPTVYRNYRLIDSLQKYGIQPGFYSWVELKNVARQLGVSKSIIRKAYRIDAMNKTLYNAYNFSRSDKSLSIKDWAKQYVTDRLITNVRSRLNTMAANINGLGNSDIPAQYEKNMYIKYVFGMRKWLINAYHDTLGGSDTFRDLREKDRKNEKTQTGLDIHGNGQIKKQYAKRTNEDLYYSGHYNPVTGMMDRGYLRELGIAVGIMLRKIKQWFIQDKNSKIKPKIPRSCYAAMGTIAILLIAYGLNIFFTPLVHQWAEYPEYQDRSKLDDGMNDSNLQKYIKYTTGISNTPSEFFNKGVYRNLIFNSYVRATSDQYNRMIAISATGELVNSVVVQKTPVDNFEDLGSLLLQTALKAGVSNQDKDLLYLFTSLDKDNKVRSGGYKNWPKGVAKAQKAAGIPKNIHLFTSNQALNSNTSLYANKFGTPFQSYNTNPFKNFWMNHGPYKFDPTKTKSFNSKNSNYYTPNNDIPDIDMPDIDIPDIDMSDIENP